MTDQAAAARVSASTANAWIGFVAMCIGMFMAILDIQIVATSLPAIQAALGIKPEQMSWIQTSYLIAEIIAIPLTGWLTRILSLRGLFMLATSIFCLASLACAASSGFEILIAARVIQGFAGGILIPVVFSAVFLLFPGRGQSLATTIAGILAVLAPTIGPIGGGWITSVYSWHWLFLVNVLPGLLTVIVAALFLPRTKMRLFELRKLDIASVVLMAAALAALEIGLKQAPDAGWASVFVLGAFFIALACGLVFIRRSLARTQPVVDLRTLQDRSFALGCCMSFVLGMGLYGTVYLMPVFLSFVRGHNSLAIGQIMLVTGIAQLISAPIVVWLELRIGAARLTAFGFVLFALGLGLSMSDTPRTDFAGMLLPQALRGFALMFCILAPTRIALGHLPPDRVPNASGLFNLMRNLGGAISLALIDSIIYGRTDLHGRELASKLLHGDVVASGFTGLPVLQPGQQITPDMMKIARPMLEKAALTLSIQEAWLMLAIVTLVGAALTLALPRRARLIKDNVGAL